VGMWWPGTVDGMVADPAPWVLIRPHAPSFRNIAGRRLWESSLPRLGHGGRGVESAAGTEAGWPLGVSIGYRRCGRRSLPLPRGLYRMS
jgi:hypothetical protein